MSRNWLYRFVVVALSMTVHSVSLANSKTPVMSDFQDDLLGNIVEVPIESIQQFVQIYGTVKDNYVSEKSDDLLFLQAIKGLVGGLDRYSRYLSAEEYRQLLKYTEEDIATVDFDLEYDSIQNEWLIKKLKPDSDSLKLGLQNGSIVRKIDQQVIKNLNADQVNDVLNGAMGTTVQLQLDSAGQVFSLVRNQKLDVADIQESLLASHVLVIKVKVFQQDTANEIKRIIDEHEPNHLKAVLIDLRNNPGGLLSSAVETADLFLNQGLIVSTQSRSEGDQQFQALPGNEFSQLKLGVLINNRSASAAEVFTAAMKDLKRATIIGEKSYGKGVVQKLFPLENGAALQMTVAHYLTPNGQMIDGIGILPDIQFPWSSEMKDETYLDHSAEQLLKVK